MEIKRINDESYESIKRYIDVMLSIIPRLNDLCFVDCDGIRYMLSIDENGIGIVENDNGELNPISLTEENNKVIFDTEEFNFEVLNQNGLKEVIRKNKLNGIGERLSYIPRVDNYPRDIIEYVQYIDSISSSATYTYDVTSRNGNLDSAFGFIGFHRPDVIKVEVLKQILFFYKKFVYHYSMGLTDDKYYEPLIAIGNLLLGTKRIVYDTRDFISELSTKGFNPTVPYELSAIIKDEDCQYKRIKSITEEYKKFIIGN